VLLVGTKSWNQLSPQHQQWLQTAADESAELQRELWAEARQDARERAEAEGVTVYVIPVTRPPMFDQERFHP